MPPASFDWITFSVETVGIVIFCIWVVVPIREFRAILGRVFKLEDAGSRRDGGPGAGLSPATQYNREAAEGAKKKGMD